MRLAPGIFLILILLIASCGEEKREARTNFQIVAGNTEAGHFRGIAMRSNMEEVKSREVMPLENEKSDELVYKAPLGESDSSYFRVYYTFDEMGLFEIQTDVFPPSAEDAQRLYDRFLKHFDKKYGKSDGPPYYATWKTRSGENRTVEITLINETQDAGKPFVSINFFEPIEKEY